MSACNPEPGWALVTFLCVLIGGCTVQDIAKHYYESKSNGVAERLEMIEQRLDDLEQRISVEESP